MPPNNFKNKKATSQSFLIETKLILRGSTLIGQKALSFWVLAYPISITGEPGVAYLISVHCSKGHFDISIAKGFPAPPSLYKLTQRYFPLSMHILVIYYEFIKLYINVFFLSTLFLTQFQSLSCKQIPPHGVNTSQHTQNLCNELFF